MIKYLLIIIIQIILIPRSNAFGFKFNLIGNGIIIQDFGSYKAWSNGSFAKSCNDYKKSVTGVYAGAIGDGIYRIKPDTNPAFNAYCDMNTDSYGWTLLFTGAILAGSGYYNSTLIDKVLNGTASGSELRSSLLVLGTSSLNGQNLMNAITRIPFEYIRFGTDNWMKSTQISTFVSKYNNLTTWDSSNCTAQFKTPGPNGITTQFYDNDSSSIISSKTKFGWNLSVTGAFCNSTTKLGCLIAVGDPTTPQDGVSGVDYSIIGLKGMITNSCSGYEISGQVNSEQYGINYLFVRTEHRSINSYTLDSQSNSKQSFIWIR